MLIVLVCEKKKKNIYLLNRIDLIYMTPVMWISLFTKERKLILLLLSYVFTPLNNWTPQRLGELDV